MVKLNTFLHQFVYDGFNVHECAIVHPIDLNITFSVIKYYKVI